MPIPAHLGPSRGRPVDAFALHVTAGPGFRREGLQGTLLSLILRGLGRDRTDTSQAQVFIPVVDGRRRGGEEHEQMSRTSPFFVPRSAVTLGG